MSGHNKWSTIKHKKAAADSKRGKIFSRLSKELTLATKIGGKEADTNPRLRTAISAAKSANMPNDNIDRAIKKGAGELGGQALEELNYEGYAPGGVAVIVDCLSDNRNRTAADIRNIFTKANATLATTGSVAWMFKRKTRFVIEGAMADEDALMELCFEADIDIDAINIDEGVAEVIAPPEVFDKLVEVFEAGGVAPTESGLVRVPENEVEVNDLSTAKQILRLVDNLEDYDDVQEVYDNSIIDDDTLAALESDD